MLFDTKSVLNPGMNFVVERMLTEADTVAYYGRKELGKIIATNAFVDMIVSATSGVVEGYLPEGLITVGRRMEFTHDAPTSLGMKLRVKATLMRIDGDRLFFNIEAWDDCGPVGSGKHERVVVNRDKLIERANQRLLGI